MKKVARPMPTSLPRRLLSILRMRTAYRNFVETCLLVARSPEYATLDSADADRLQLRGAMTRSATRHHNLRQHHGIHEPDDQNAYGDVIENRHGMAVPID